MRDLVKTYPAPRAKRLRRSAGRGTGRRSGAATPAAAAGSDASEAPPGPVRACDGVDLDIHAGEIFGLLGPNGAGKSTLVRQLTGLLRPDSGGIELFGHDLVRRPELAARLLAYLGQESTALDDLTVALAAETTARLRGLAAPAARAERDPVEHGLGLDDVVRDEQ
ncbi:ATP-binding cassette domain-containing protein, partial [Streptomyces synnematoformans]|uniref:ATP-binding cassette domain-containing protein n=1 Tax=Streptomyces synnematoformans TaxID=415721 RepID=UPI0031DBD18F